MKLLDNEVTLYVANMTKEEKDAADEVPMSHCEYAQQKISLLGTAPGPAHEPEDALRES